MNAEQKLAELVAWVAEWRTLAEQYPTENRKQAQQREGEERVIGEIERLLGQ